MEYYRNLYINNNYMMGLLLDDGSFIRCYTESDISACCNSQNSGSTIAMDNGIIFRKDSVKSIYFSNGWNLNNLPAWFCHGFINLTHLDPLPNIITSIGIRFAYGWNLFNESITLPNSITSIGDYFIFNHQTYNKSIILSENLSTIGPRFLSASYMFNQPLTIPESVTTIGSDFMSECTNFTGPLKILFTNAGRFKSGVYELSTSDNTAPMYTTGVTITGNMTGAQLRTRLPNLGGEMNNSYKYRKILG